MIRRALKSQKAARGAAKIGSFTLPAPTGGWNVRDPLAVMPEKDAVVLENWFPQASDVVIRKGVESWATGFVTQPDTLLYWNGASSRKLFAAAGGGIYEVTAAGAIGAAATTITEGFCSFVNTKTPGGSYLVSVNGTDKLKLFDGATWTDIDNTSTPAITGVATTTLSQVALIKKRLWFVQKDTMSAWYLSALAIAGAAVEFPLGSVFARGGHLVAITNWTVDGGNGSDDYTVFASSEGEVAVYQGMDPGTADTFKHVGTYYIGEPLGNRCFCKFGGDVLFLCQNGLVPLSKALQSTVVNKQAALTSKIDTAFSKAASTYHSNKGWSVCAYPAGNLVIVNIPISSTTTQQYVMNAITGAWCKFTGIFAHDWVVFGSELYCAGKLRIGHAWTGASDYGANIVPRGQQAYSFCGVPGRQKHIKLLRPILTLDGPLTVSMSLDTDFEISPFAYSAVAAGVSGDVFDASDWDSAVWAGDGTIQKDWVSAASPVCYAASPRLQCSTNSITVSWEATVIAFELGSLL